MERLREWIEEERMVSIMKSLNAFDELINEVSAHKITYAAKACTERLKVAVDDLRKFFDENPGDRLSLQNKYNVANTYALQVEYFLCMHDAECNRRYKERENAKALYELARQLLYRYVDDEKPEYTRDFFLIVNYVNIAQRYLMASQDFVIDMSDAMKIQVEEMSKYIAEVARDISGITVEEYNARSASAHKNEETEDVATDNNEEGVITDDSSVSESAEGSTVIVVGETPITIVEDKEEPYIERSVPNAYDF